MTEIHRSTLDAMLTSALRPRADAAPMPDGLVEVPARWVHGSLARRASQVFVGGASLAVAVVATIAVVTLFSAIREAPATGSGESFVDAGVPMEAFDPTARPGDASVGEPATGPVVEVARGRMDGRDFSYLVYRGSPPNDVCVQFDWEPDSWQGCGALPGQGSAGGESFGLASTSEGSTVVHEASGIVAANVAGILVETSDGGQAGAELVDLEGTGIDARLFIAFLPGGVDARAYVAVDHAGNEINRWDMPAGPPDIPGPDPTPAAAP